MRLGAVQLFIAFGRGVTLALALIAAKGFVAQGLLVAHQLIEFAHFPAQFLLRRACAPSGALHVFEQVLQLIEHGLRLRFLAGAGCVLHLVEQFIEILGRQILRILILLVVRALREFAREFFGRRAQFLHQFADFLVAGAAIERLAQLLLGGAQIALGLRGVAVLDLQRHRPKEIGDADEVLIIARVGKMRLREFEAEIDRRGGAENFWRDQHRVERGGDARAIGVGIEHEIAPLLDQGARQRIVEASLRQGQRDRLARPCLAGKVMRGENHRHMGAGPWMFGQIARRLRLADAIGAAGQLQRHLRRFDQRTALGRLSVNQGLCKIGLGARHAILIGEFIRKGQRTPRIGLRAFRQRDRRLFIGDRGDLEGGQRRAAAADAEFSVAFDRPAVFPGGGIGRGLGGLACGRLGRCDRRQRALGVRGDGVVAGAQHKDGAGRRRDLLVARVLAERVEQDRRFAGIGGRVDPGVDAKPLRDRRLASPVEGRGDARIALGACDESGANRKKDGAETQRAYVAVDHARRRRRHVDAGDRRSEAALVQIPQRARRFGGRRVGEPVEARRGRLMRRCAVAIEAGERLGAARRPQKA